MAKKLAKVPRLDFNLICESVDLRGCITRAYYCEQHPEIEVRVHHGAEPWKQVFLVDDDDDITNYPDVKAAYRRLMSRPGNHEINYGRLQAATERTQDVDGDGRTTRTKRNVPKKRRRSRARQEREDNKQRVRRRTKRT